MIEKNRIQNQDDWKRTQFRIPCSQYNVVADYAKSSNVSLNSAMLELISIGLISYKEKSLNKELLNDSEQNVENKHTFNDVELIKISNNICVLAIDSTTGSKYFLSVNDLPSLSKSSAGTVLTINHNGTPLQYVGTQVEEMFEKIPKLLYEMDWRNNSIHSPESIYNRRST